MLLKGFTDGSLKTCVSQLITDISNVIVTIFKRVCFKTCMPSYLVECAPIDQLGSGWIIKGNSGAMLGFKVQYTCFSLEFWEVRDKMVFSRVTELAWKVLVKLVVDGNHFFDVDDIFYFILATGSDDFHKTIFCQQWKY